MAWRIVDNHGTGKQLGKIIEGTYDEAKRKADSYGKKGMVIYQTL